MEKENKAKHIESTENPESIIENGEKIIRNAGVYNDIEPEIIYAEVPVENKKLPILLSWYKKIKIIKLLKIMFRGNKKGIEGENK